MSDPVIFSQAFDGTGTANLSQESPDQVPPQFAKTWDDFSFASGAIVTDVHWTGGLAPPPSEIGINGFKVEFWSDSGGLPGTQLSTETFSLGDTSPVSLGTFGGLPCFSHSVDLSAHFTASAGVTYWLLIMALISTAPPLWNWATAGGGNSVQSLFGAPAAPTGSDQAFDLTGTPLMVCCPLPVIKVDMPPPPVLSPAMTGGNEHFAREWEQWFQKVRDAIVGIAKKFPPP